MDLKLDLHALLDPFSPQNIIELETKAPPGILESVYGPQFNDILLDSMQEDPTKFSAAEQSAIITGKVPHNLQYSILEKLERPQPSRRVDKPLMSQRFKPMKPLGAEAFVPAKGPSLPLEAAPQKRLPAALRDLLLPQRDPDA